MKLKLIFAFNRKRKINMEICINEALVFELNFLTKNFDEILHILCFFK